MYRYIPLFLQKMEYCDFRILFSYSVTKNKLWYYMSLWHINNLVWLALRTLLGTHSQIAKSFSTFKTKFCRIAQPWSLSMKMLWSVLLGVNANFWSVFLGLTYNLLFCLHPRSKYRSNVVCTTINIFSKFCMILSYTPKLFWILWLFINILVFV